MMKDKLFKTGHKKNFQLVKKTCLLAFAFVSGFSALFIPTYLLNTKNKVEEVIATESSADKNEGSTEIELLNY